MRQVAGQILRKGLHPLVSTSSWGPRICVKPNEESYDILHMIWPCDILRKRSVLGSGDFCGLLIWFGDWRATDKYVGEAALLSVSYVEKL